MKQLYIIYHSKTGNTKLLVDAAYAGATNKELDPVKVTVMTAREAGPKELLEADGLILATPENFGYMSGALKDFLDRTFYEVEGQLNPLPYAVLISAGNDGSGALRAIERIANGYPFIKVAEPIIVQGVPTDTDIEKSHELGMTMAAGLALGMY